MEGGRPTSRGPRRARQGGPRLCFCITSLGAQAAQTTLGMGTDTNKTRTVLSAKVQDRELPAPRGTGGVERPHSSWPWCRVRGTLAEVLRGPSHPHWGCQETTEEEQTCKLLGNRTPPEGERREGSQLAHKV